MDDDIAIKVDGVYKDFKLPHEQSNSLKSLFMNIGKKRRKGYEVQHALKDISFEVKKGEFFGIVGRNGSGKSTLLKIIAEIYRPTKGEVTKSGRLVPFIELGVGFNPELTGRENVYLNGALLGFPKKEVEAMYDDIVAFAELEKFMDQKLKNYSSGMQVRLAFAVAIRANAEIMLIDEVLAVGDADFQRKCFDYFKTLKKQGTTVIFVSHDMESVKEFCDRAILISESVVIHDGDPSDVAQEYNRLFISDKQRKGTDAGRWGDGTAKFTSVRVDGFDSDSEKITIKSTLTGLTNIEGISVGFMLRNIEDKVLFGFNTKEEDVKISHLKKGGAIKVTWTLPNILPNGTFMVDLAASHDGGRTSEWWRDAARFNVTTTKRTRFITNPRAAVSVDEE